MLTRLAIVFVNACALLAICVVANAQSKNETGSGDRAGGKLTVKKAPEQESPRQGPTTQGGLPNICVANPKLCESPKK